MSERPARRCRPGRVRRALAVRARGERRDGTRDAVPAPGAREADTASALFALEGRVRPFNKYLEQELRDRPIAGGAITIDDVIALLEGDASRQRTIFRTVEQRAKEEGFGEVIAGWEPDVAWLRGEAGYREAASGGGGVARG